MANLDKIREEIDSIDEKIVDLFQHRMEVAKKVAEYKIETKKPVFDKQREKEKLSALGKLGSSSFNQHGIEELFTQIMSISRKFQYGLVGGNEGSLGFESCSNLHIDSETEVACFGIKGSHTERATKEFFGQDIKCLNYTSFREIMQAVKTNKVQYGVLPIENTSTGSIADIYDLLDEYENFIVGEKILKIEQILLGLKGADIKSLKRVYSHPQGLMQCGKFLEENGQIEQVECQSTSESAMRVVKENDKTHGAIAGRQAANYYGLEILSDNIQFNQANSTRFIVVCNKKMYVDNADRISICFELPHESGSLYNMLSNLIYNNLNMTQIESRPIIGKSFEYRFFVEFEGNVNESGVRNALQGISQEASKFKVLGNFIHDVNHL